MFSWKTIVPRKKKTMSNLKKPIDFKMLENELDTALRADELYKLQNDAKLRAIEQRVPTYDHFRDMVQAAHLRPLERSEMQKKVEVSWNHCYSKNDDEEILKIHGPLNSCDINLFESTEPQNSAEFLKNWKNLSGHSHKFEYLLRFRNGLRDKFFKVEVPAEFLEEFFKLSLDICCLDVFLEIVEILQIFAECNRFALSLAMISEPGKNCSQLLFENLVSLARNSTENEAVERLVNKYCVSL